MLVYYKRIKVWDKWPDNDQTIYDMVHYSIAKKKFDEHVFLKLDPSTDQRDRIKQISTQLKQPVKKLTLIKL